MIASIIPSKLNIVERQKIEELIEKIFNTLSVQRNWIRSDLVSLLKMPTTKKIIEIPDTARNMLYTIESLNFDPYYIKTLEFAALGSGKDSVDMIKRYSDWICACAPGDFLMKSFAFREAVTQFFEDNKIINVCGLYPCIRLMRTGAIKHGMRQSFPDSEISIKFDQMRNRWMQENHTTNKKIELLPPWEIDIKKIAYQNENTKFDDMQEARNNFLNQI